MGEEERDIQQSLNLQRIDFNPEFPSDVDLKEAIGIAIAEEARRYRVSYKEFQKKHPIITRRTTKDVVNRRCKESGDKSHLFYSHLYTALFGGEINRLGPEGRHYGFHPDVTRTDNCFVYDNEIKCASKKNGKSKIGCNQFINYCGGFLASSYKWFVPDLSYAIFRYGKSHNSERLFQYNNEKLIERLSHNTQDLLILPLNVLILSLLPLSIKNYNHSSSGTARDVEPYWNLLGGAITNMHKNPKMADEMSGNLQLRGLSRKELCLEGLERTQYLSPSRVYCKGYKVNPFLITHYKNRDARAWAQSFHENYEKFMDALELHGVLDDLFLREEEIDKPLLKRFEREFNETAGIYSEESKEPKESDEVLPELEAVPF